MAKFLKKSKGDRYEINLDGRRPASDRRGLRKAARDEAAMQDYGRFTSLLNNEVSFGTMNRTKTGKLQMPTISA